MAPKDANESSTLQEMVESSAGGEASIGGEDVDGKNGDSEDSDGEIASH